MMREPNVAEDGIEYLKRAIETTGVLGMWPKTSENTVTDTVVRWSVLIEPGLKKTDSGKMARISTRR